MTDTIHFTDEARKYLTPRSAEELPKRKTKDRAALWAELRAGLHTLVAQRPWTTTAPTLAEPLAQARRILVNEKEPREEPLALAWSLLLRIGFTPANGVRGLGYLTARLGLPRALEVLLDASAIDAEDMPSGEGMLHLRAAWPLLGSGIDELVLRASTEQRETVEALAMQRWPSAPLLARMVIVEALPHRHDLANAIVPDWLAHPRRSGEGWRVLIARIDDLALCKPLIDDAISANVVDLVRTFGERALPVLAESLERAKDPHAYKHLARAVSLHDDPRAAQALAAVATRSVAQPFVLDFFHRHPRYADAALGPMAKGKSKGAQAVTEILERVRRGAPAAAPEAGRARPPQGSVAMPAILARPPWKAEKPKKKGPLARRPVVIERALEVAFVSRIEPDPEPDARARSERSAFRRFDAETAQAYVAATHAKTPKTGVQGRWHQLPGDDALALYNALPAHRSHRFFSVMMAQEAIAFFGMAALPGLVDHARRSLDDEYGRPYWALRVVAPEMALALLEGADNEDAAPLVQGWIATHFDAALAGFLSAAVGPLGRVRTLAERGLIELARLRGEAPILALASRSGDDVVASAREILASALVIARPAKAPKLPASLRLAELPPVRLRGQSATLDAEAVEALCTYLAASGLALVHPALAEVKAACEPLDLAELAWTLSRGWELGGAKKRERWMIDALVPLADDDVVRRILPGFKQDRAVSVLGAIGTDAAAAELLRAIEKGRLHAMAAGTAFQSIAASRGLTPDELEESLAPIFLDGTTMSLTLGGEPYTLALDEHFAVTFVRADGRRLERLPPARDDESTADRRVRARAAELTADVALLVRRRLLLLERRMIRGGTIACVDFETRHLRHPLWGPIARRIVWSAVDDSGTCVTTFRIAEDGSLADEQDRPFALSTEVRVGVPHPLRLSDERRARWAQLLHDYVIVQPFPQIGRALPQLTEAELAASQIERPTAEPASEAGGGPLVLPPGHPNGSVITRRIGLGDFRELVLRASSQPPFVASVSLGRGAPGSPRETLPLAELGPLLVAEYLAAVGAC